MLSKQVVVRKLKSKKNGELLKTVVEHQEPDGMCTIYTYPAGMEVPPISNTSLTPAAAMQAAAAVKRDDIGPSIQANSRGIEELLEREKKIEKEKEREKQRLKRLEEENAKAAMLKDSTLTALAIKKRQKDKAAKKKFGQVSTIKRNLDDEEKQGLDSLRNSSDSRSGDSDVEARQRREDERKKRAKKNKNIKSEVNNNKYILNKKFGIKFLNFKP